MNSEGVFPELEFIEALDRRFNGGNGK